MKKSVLLGGILLLCVNLYARQETKASTERYSVTLMGVYDYSKTFSHCGGIDLAGHLPFCNYAEADAAFEFLGPKILAGTFVARPKLPLKKGEIFAEGAVHMRSFNQSGTGTFALAASLGYRMEFFSVQLGAQRTEIADLRSGEGSSDGNIVEPMNLIFRLAFNLRPATSPWNVSLGIANFTPYQYERLYYPIFFAGGRYALSESLTLGAIADFKPSGIFNMTAHFNEFSFRAGVIYSF